MKNECNITNQTRVHGETRRFLGVMVLSIHGKHTIQTGGVSGGRANMTLYGFSPRKTGDILQNDQWL